MSNCNMLVSWQTRTGARQQWYSLSDVGVVAFHIQSIVFVMLPSKGGIFACVGPVPMKLRRSRLFSPTTAYAVLWAIRGYQQHQITIVAVVDCTVELWSGLPVQGSGLVWFGKSNSGRHLCSRLVYGDLFFLDAQLERQAGGRQNLSIALDTVPPLMFFSFQGGKDKSKHAAQANREQGGDRTQRGTTLLSIREVMQDCLSFPNERKKIACLPSNQEVIAW